MTIGSTGGSKSRTSSARDKSTKRSQESSSASSRSSRLRPTLRQTRKRLSEKEPVSAAYADARQLSALAYGNGFTLWVYRGEDSIKQILRPNFFASVAGHIRLYDWIIVARHGVILFVAQVEPNIWTQRIE